MCCIFCRGISPEPATKHVTFEAVVEDASPRHLLFKGVFTKGTLVDGVTVANHPPCLLPCPVLSCPLDATVVIDDGPGATLPAWAAGRCSLC